MSNNLKKSLLLPLLFFVLILVVTVIGFYFVQNSLKKQAEIRLEEDSNRIVYSAQTRLNRDLYLLNGIRGLYAASDEVDRDEFYTYLDQVESIKNYPGIYAIGYLEKVYKEDVSSFEKSVSEDISFNKNGYPNFSVKPKNKDKEYYFALKYAYPEMIMAGVLGQDFSYDEIRSSAIAMALKNGEVIVTSKVYTFTDNESAINMFLPVYKNGSERIEKNIIGLLLVVIKIDKFFPDILSENLKHKELGLHIYENNELTGIKDELFIDHHEDSEFHSVKSLSQSFTITFAQRNWIFEFFVKNNYALSLSEKLIPWLILFIGLLFSIIIFVSVFNIIKRQEKAEFLAKEMTEKSAENEEKFRLITESAHDSIVMMDNLGNVVLWNKASEIMFGYTKDEMRGKYFHALVASNKIHQNKKDNILNFGRTGMSDVLDKAVELEVKKKDGTKFMVELTVSRVNIKGVWHAIGIMRDISIRKQEEDKLKERTEELERMNRVMIGRELKMSELKQEIQKLKNKN